MGPRRAGVMRVDDPLGPLIGVEMRAVLLALRPEPETCTVIARRVPHLDRSEVERWLRGAALLDLCGVQTQLPRRYYALRHCRQCLCTDGHACIDALGETCGWVQADLCSFCAARGRAAQPAQPGTRRPRR